VLKEAREALSSASSSLDLYLMVGAYVDRIKAGGQLDSHPTNPTMPGHALSQYEREKFERSVPRIPGDKAVGIRFWVGGSTDMTMRMVVPLVCNQCGHVELFSGLPSPRRV
jgi:hypothetical protein